MANLIDFIGRLLISALFLISAYNKIFSIDGTMSWMEGYGIPGFLLYPTIALEIILPLFVIIGYQARVSAGLLAIFCIATAFLFHFDALCFFSSEHHHNKIQPKGSSMKVILGAKSGAKTVCTTFTPPPRIVEKK